MIGDFLWWVTEKSWLNNVCLPVCLFCLSVCLPVYLSVQAFWHMDHEQLGRSGPARIRSTRRNAGKTTMRRASCGPIGVTWHVPSAVAWTLAKKNFVNDAGQTNGRIRLKLCRSIVTMSGHVPVGGGANDGGAPFARAGGTSHVF